MILNHSKSKKSFRFEVTSELIPDPDGPISLYSVISVPHSLSVTVLQIFSDSNRMPAIYSTYVSGTVKWCHSLNQINWLND